MAVKWRYCFININILMHIVGTHSERESLLTTLYIKLNTRLYESNNRIFKILLFVSCYLCI